MSVQIDAIPATAGRDWLTGAALIALIVTFGIVAGPLGVLAGIATAIVGYLLGPPYALAAGHVALVASIPGELTLLSIGLVEAAFMAVLLAPIRRSTRPVHIALVAITTGFALAGIVWLTSDSQPLWLAAMLVLTLIAIALYGLHRLELVKLGLVSDERDSTGQPASEPPDEQPTETTADAPTKTASDT
ncbi:hypothetical protein [Natrinema sp. H-ect4]|uniref:hypothetical protein n=1 Tax=Natrinema sp. H-ect4 TaxID=3242699 RepID=UPI0035A969D8